MKRKTIEAGSSLAALYQHKIAYEGSFAKTTIKIISFHYKTILQITIQENGTAGAIPFYVFD